MLDQLLIDSDVLVDYLRNQPQAVLFIEKHHAKSYISSISVAELYAGVRDGSERTRLDHFITSFNVISINCDIAVQGGLIRNKFKSSNGISLPDALTAATAQYYSKTLVTLNKKHYPMLNVIVPYRKH